MDFEEFKLQTARRLKELRIEAGKSQEHLSGLDLSVKSYGNLERGATAMSLRSLFVLSQNLGVHPREFFDFPVPWEGNG